MDLLQNFGMLLCVGALILVGLLVFRTLFRNRNNAANTSNRPAYDQDDRVFNEQGSARPQYDDRDVQTSGGFGVPATGGGSSSGGGFGARDYVQPRQQDTDNDSFMYLDDRLRSRDRDAGDNPPVNRPRRQRDDDDIQSSGGFGR